MSTAWHAERGNAHLLQERLLSIFGLYASLHRAAKVHKYRSPVVSNHYVPIQFTLGQLGQRVN